MSGLLLDQFKAVRALEFPPLLEEQVYEALIALRRIGYMIESGRDIPNVARDVTDSVIITLADKLGKNIWE